jgi:hypothetical protein
MRMERKREIDRVSDLLTFEKSEMLMGWFDLVSLVLKVWGIVTHAQMDKRLWSSLSKESRRRTKEYIQKLVYSVIGDLRLILTYFPHPKSYV